MTISDKLTALNDAKQAIKAAIESKGQVVGSAPLSDYADKISAITTGGVAPWVRPSDWLPLTDPAVGEQKIVILYGVVNGDLNTAAFTVSGAYTVDWGDGTTTNYGAGVTASKTYIHADVPENTQLSTGTRQVIITITPQSGANLTSFTAVSQPTSGRCISFMDVIVRCPSMSIMSFSNSQAKNTIMQRVKVIQCAPTVTTLSLASACYLECFEIPEATSVTTMLLAFSGCNLLREVPFFNTANATTFANAFQNCFSLVKLPQFDTGNSTSFASTFSGCSSLAYIPPMNTSKATTVSGMFASCASLNEPPVGLNTAKCTTVTSLFSGCTSLKSIPWFDTSSVGPTGFSQLFSNCANVLELPLIDFSKMTTATLLMNSCDSLREYPAWDFSSVTGVSSMNPTNTSVFRSRITGLKITHTYANMKLGKDALVEIFTNLPTVTGQTITITGNYGVSSLTAGDRAIATGKGWTISG